MVGVSAAAGAMSSLLGKLTALLGEEYKLLKGVRKEVEFLQRELSSIKAFLETLGEMDKLDRQTKDWRDGVREMSYDMEDCIDRFMERLDSGDATDGFMRKFARSLRTVRARHSIASQIKGLKALVVEAKERRDRYKLEEHKPSNVEIDARLPALYAEAKGLVGIDGPRDQVIAWMRDDKVERKVISIAGFGGLGKTTLAMEVYRKIGREFQCRASVSVSRTLDLKKLLKDMLYQIDKDEFPKSELLEKEQLILKLRHMLEGKRYFIIIDDVWSIQDWKFVESALPENNNGSRVIITTRKNDVAKSCCSNSGDQFHQMGHLNDADSQRLFFRRIFDSDNCCPAHLKEVSDNILKKCGGLPLAIVTLASLLANKSESKDQWEVVLHSIGSALGNVGELDGMRNILLLSYRDLPSNLKTCLLYVSIYPEDYEIRVTELIWRWIAEGFISNQMGQTLWETAESYYNELVNRSMIQPVDIHYDGRHMFCQIHDMVLDLIISLSTGENFVTLLDGQEHPPWQYKIRRLSLQCNYTKEDGVIKATMRSRSHVRSLTAFRSTNMIPHLLGFHALRVLDFDDDCQWLENHHIRDIGSLFQLKYLRIGFNWKISEIPKEIGTLQCLRTLDIRFCSGIRELPVTIVQLRKLVRLHVYPTVKLPAEIGDMQSLEELLFVGACENPLKFLEQLGKLKNLRILCIALKNLRDLCIDYPRLVRNSDDLGKFDDILVSSLGALGRHNLRELVINMGSCRVPNGFSLVNLVKLDIRGERMQEEDLYLLGALPALLDLHIVLLDAPVKRIVVVNQGFQLLKELGFYCLGGGTGVVFAPGAVPQLQRLELRFMARDILSKYGGADPGIRHLSGLKYLRARVDCEGATKGDVEASEAAIRDAASLLPNCSTLQIVLENNGQEDTEQK